MEHSLINIILFCSDPDTEISVRLDFDVASFSRWYVLDKYCESALEFIANCKNMDSCVMRYDYFWKF